MHPNEPKALKTLHPVWMGSDHGTVCPGSSDPFYIVNYYIIWVELLPGHTVLILDGSSEHVVPAWRKMGLFGF